jgi:hypothetical protein
MVECGEKTGIGFSKVSWPDTWNLKTGFNLALGKAMADFLSIGGSHVGDSVLHFAFSEEELFAPPFPGIPADEKDTARAWEQDCPVSPMPSSAKTITLNRITDSLSPNATSTLDALFDE